MSEVLERRVVIVGGGFGGVRAAQALAGVPVRVTLVDRTNYHLFQPLLYQVATGILSEGEVAPALRSILRRQANTEVLLADVTRVDLEAQSVSALGPDGRALALSYDFLVVAAGARHGYFGHDEWEPFAPGLKTLDDAREMRSRILRAFEMAELEGRPDERRAWLTFAVVGAGPTGVELTGEIAALARRTLARDFRGIATGDARVVLVEAGSAVLPSFRERLRRLAARDLERMGVEIRLGAPVVAVDAEGIDVHGPEGLERIPSRTVIWAAGVQASPLGRVLARRAAPTSTARAVSSFCPT